MTGSSGGQVSVIGDVEKLDGLIHLERVWDEVAVRSMMFYVPGFMCTTMVLALFIVISLEKDISRSFLKTLCSFLSDIIHVDFNDGVVSGRSSIGCLCLSAHRE